MNVLHPIILDLTGAGGSLANCSPVLLSHSAKSWQLETPFPPLHFGSDSTHSLASLLSRRHRVTPLSRQGGREEVNNELDVEEDEDDEDESEEDEEEEEGKGAIREDASGNAGSS